ncbi:MAG: hypothetical protein JXJ17_16215 [Anaerolineae bacterium]|nr:hypothetical protein [Anaerolineae bacterium]
MRHVTIRIKGQLDADWSDWFGGLQLTHLNDNESLLTGEIKDQPELYGVLSKVRDLGLELVSVDVRGHPESDQVSTNKNS